MKDKMKDIAVFLAIAVLAGCGDGAIPTMKTYIGDAEVDRIRLPVYSPPAGSESSMLPRYATYGTEGTRINPEDLYIKNVYRTSDDVIHIILNGKISNGIPEGLLWNEKYDADFGVPSGSYSGRGDFKIGQLIGGSSPAIGSLDFSAEWVMSGPYTAVVIEGLVDNIPGTTVIEKNESLNLLSFASRDKPYPETALYSSPDGRLQKTVTIGSRYNPNNFKYWPDPSWPPGNNITSYWDYPGDSRGGYVILISKSEKAVPYIASFDISYPDGTEKRFEVDYSDVHLREDKEIQLTQISFGVSLPSSSLTLSPEEYSPDASNPGYYIMSYTIIEQPLNSGDITKENPLLLRPVYEPVDIDPRKTTTNMINDIYLTDVSGKPMNDDNLVLTWEDKTQSIAFYIKVPPITVQTSVTINASLRLPFETTDPITSQLVNVKKLTCTFTLDPPP